MDITLLFKACVKTVRLRNKIIYPTPDKNRILKHTSNKDDFIKKSMTIRYQITELKSFLIENRAAYMQFACHLKNSAKMTDDERNIIDKESEKILNIVTKLIYDFKTELNKAKLPHQIKEHRDGVLELLTNYLKVIYNLYNEQKKNRIQRELENYRLLKLKSDKQLFPTAPTKLILENNIDVETDIEEKKIEIKQNTLHQFVLDEDIISNQLACQDDEISTEDIQMFESENMQLFNELKGLSEEVEQIEKNVVDIANLQEIFTEKVTLQKHDIDRIASTVVGATENVKDANEQIKQAIQRNAGLRVYVLFFLLVMSFSLLFLDWYND